MTEKTGIEQLQDLLAPITWEERAQADSGQPIAPATDAEGRDCWNVWVQGDQSSPHTFYSNADAKEFADRKSDDGLRVFTDFSGDTGDSGELFGDGCS